MSVLAISEVDRIAIFQMQDQRRRNALGVAMLDALCHAFDTLSDQVRVVVLRTEPDASVWCAGFDIGELSPGMDPLAMDGALQGLFRRVEACAVPVIGMLHGSAWGGGTDLALRCDWLIGDPTASLAFTPAKLGLPYDLDGLANVVSRAGPGFAMEMFATAEPVLAERAVQAGLMTQLVPAAALEDETMAMARRIAANAPLTVASAKRHIRALAKRTDLPAELAEALAAGRRAALESADFAEGLAAFRGKRAPNFSGR